MVQEYTAAEAEKRQSSSIGVIGYIRKVAFPIGLGAAGALAGYFLGKQKINGQSLPYFDGKPPFRSATEKLFDIKHIGDSERAIQDQQMAHFFGSTEKAAAFRENTWNIIKGFVPAEIFVAFTNWREKEGTQISLYEIADDIHTVEKWHQGKEDLLQDNEVTKMQIDHIRTQRGDTPLFYVSHSEHQGPLSTHTKESALN